MNWKSIIIGAVVTLIITIVSGILVYYFTVKRDSEERLVYTIDKPLGFKSDSNSVSIQNISLANFGGATAENIDIAITFSKDNNIEQKSIAISSGIEDSYKILKDSLNSLRINVKSLAPKEQLTISLLLKKTSSYDAPKVSAKSNKSLAFTEEIEKQKDNIKDLDRFFPVFFPFIIFLQLILTLYLRRLRNPYRANNVAFLFIHNKLNNEAKELLERQINTSGGDAIIISNYALAIAIDGDFVKAEKLLKSALYYKSLGNQTVYCFNASIISFLSGDNTNGEIFLKEAVKHSKKEIIKYVGMSSIIVDLKSDANINRIFQNAIQ